MKSQAGAVAQQQALVLVFGLSYRAAARVAGIHHRNLWSHVAARDGSNVAPWDSRPFDVRREAVQKVIENVVEKAAPGAECRFIYEFDGANFVEIETDDREAVKNALAELKCEKMIGDSKAPFIFEIPSFE